MSAEFQNIQADKGLNHSWKSKELKILLNMKKMNYMDIENPNNIPKAKWILMVVRTGQRFKSIWSMLQEANRSFDVYPPLAFFDNENAKKLHKYCSVKLLLLFTPPFIEFWTFSLDIGGLSPDGSIRTKIGTESRGEAVGVLTPVMFNAGEKP